MTRFYLTAALSLLTASSAMAQANLQITEIFPGVAFDIGGNITEDWFEVTNFGDAPWVFDTDGPLFYDDESADETTADPLLISTLTEIAPGQSVVFVNSDESLGDGVPAFLEAFPTVDPDIVGSFLGSGLGGGGDAVALFTGTPNPFPAEGIFDQTLLDLEAYPNLDEAVNGGAVIDGATFDTFNRRFSVEGVFGAFAGSVTTELDLEPIDLTDPDNSGDGVGDGVFVPIVGSPGVAVPEPTSVLLAAVSLLGLAGRRRV